MYFKLGFGFLACELFNLVLEVPYSCITVALPPYQANKKRQASSLLQKQTHKTDT